MESLISQSKSESLEHLIFPSIFSKDNPSIPPLSKQVCMGSEILACCVLDILAWEVGRESKDFFSVDYKEGNWKGILDSLDLYSSRVL